MKDRARGYAHRVDVAADPQDVWRAITEQAQLVQWCSPRARIQPRQGGLFRASVDRLTELEAHIDVFEPARRLRLIYLPNSALPPTEDAIVADFILDRLAPGTILRLLGSGIPATAEWNAHYLRQRMGWQQAVQRLKVMVEARTQRMQASRG